MIRRIALVLAAGVSGAAMADATLDARIADFLERNRGEWTRGINYWNVPYEDGQLLHDLVVRGGFRRVLEIGTSTGHSTVWLARAVAKTGGAVVTLEIDRRRHEQALRNFRSAGVAHLVDARLGDAHGLLERLDGPWDFVFQDADKEGYLRYWLRLREQIAPGGCFTAHNVLRPASPEVVAFMNEVQRTRGFATRVEDAGSGEGLSVSCRQ